MKINIPHFVDVEASSLRSNSYPIEVAWNLADDSIESYLISPVGIEQWKDWSTESQGFHGIRRQELIEAGRDPAWICARMNQQLEGKVVYSDNPEWDGKWLEELFSVAGGVVMGFTVGSSEGLLFDETFSDFVEWSRYEGRVKQLKYEARMRAGGQHRASMDVRYLVELWKLVRGEGGGIGDR
ncbi:MAG: hypothetical protein QOH96_3478 [Blastocatellia bacterium]|nr:hypothetical protein [Blastocatellia bacterium]